MPVKYCAPAALIQSLLTTAFCFGLSSQVLAATTLDDLPPENFDTQGWYQVELIVFSNSKPSGNSDEIWPLAQLQYPEGMVSIAPENPQNYQPHTLGQMQDNERYLALWDGMADFSSPETSDFLFESRNPITLPQPNFRSNDRVSSPPPAIQSSGTGEGLSTEDDSELEVLIDFDSLFTPNQVVAFKELPSQQRILNSIARSIRRSSMYQMIVHKSWLQPIVSDSEALPILIQGGAHFDDFYEIDGTISISRSRFLHIDTDLWFTQFTTSNNDRGVISQTGSELTQNQGGQQNPSLLTSALKLTPDQRTRYPRVATWVENQNRYLPVHSHQLLQTRRMRSSTMHFIDHPQFGVLVKIERYEAQTGD